MKQRENAMLTQGAGLNYLLPQWSPPVTGGSTGPAFGQVDGVAVAAMESAADRREHGQAGLSLAACTDLPQWSPPPIGGSTSMPAVTQTASTVLPQWSPPTIGGSTVAKIGKEAALAKPQWSPPTIGGSTPTAVSMTTLARPPQ